MSGVEHRIVSADEAGMRLDRFIARCRPGLPVGLVQKLLRTGQVRVDGGRAKGQMRLVEGQDVRLPPVRDPPTRSAPRAPSETDVKEMRRRVLYRDEAVIVIDKPAGLAVQGGSGLTRHLDALLDALAVDGERPKLVHRLDRDTSGVLLLARDASAARALTRAFRGHEVRKEYWAVTAGVPQPRSGTIDLPLRKGGAAGQERVAVDEDQGKPARSLYSVVEAVGAQAAWVALWPLTGRTHQLRVHLAALGCPILGDGKYGRAASRLTGIDLPNGLHLHARSLSLTGPHGLPISVTAPLPPHMKPAWQAFGFAPRPVEDPFAGMVG